MDIQYLQPKTHILPPHQKRLWPELEQVPDGFTLYGGTAIALQLGHRESVDFDFFTPSAFDPDSLLGSLPFLGQSRVVQMAPNTLTVLVDRGGQISVSFFGLPRIGPPIKPPLKCADNGIKVASLLDLAGMKASVVQKRAEWKDYVDIAALIDAGVGLDMALSAGKAIYKDQFNPQVTLKALSYFDDVPNLSANVKTRLQEAVRQVDLRNLPALDEVSP
jgi:hypothetical protein